MRGQEILVAGQWNGDVLTAQRMTLEPTRDQLGRVRDVVVEGYVQDLGGGSMSLGRGSMLLDAQARVTGGGSTGLALNQFVRVTGRMDDERRIRVEQVVIDAGGGPSGGSSSSPSSGQGSSGSSGSSGSGSSGSSGSGSGSGSSGSGAAAAAAVAAAAAAAASSGSGSGSGAEQRQR